jgi:predicted transcriptional regulator of viral defense system
MKNASGIDTKNRRLLDLLNRLGKNIFSIEEAAVITGLTIIEARLLLGYFARRGWLSRVKPGFYMSVPLGTMNPHEYKENPLIVANRIFAPCYIGGWSAAEHWDLTDQIFNSIYVCTSKVFRKKTTTIQGTEFILKLKRQAGHTKSLWLENTKIQVSDPAQTVVDILDDPSSGGGMRHVSEIVKNYFESEHRNKFDLAMYLSECKNHTAYKRLGYMLEVLKIEAVDLIEECRKNISAGYSVFDPGIKTKGTYNRRWNLRVNAEI